MTGTSDNATHGGHWYRQPVAWLGIAVTGAILAGCLWTIAVSSRYTDVPTHGNAPTLLGMPLAAPSSSTGTGTP